MRVLGQLRVVVTQDLGMMRQPGNNLYDRQRVRVVLPPV
jgi:hypothetical protein